MNAWVASVHAKDVKTGAEPVGDSARNTSTGANDWTEKGMSRRDNVSQGLLDDKEGR